MKYYYIPRTFYHEFNSKLPTEWEKLSYATQIFSLEINETIIYSMSWKEISEKIAEDLWDERDGSLDKWPMIFYIWDENHIFIGKFIVEVDYIPKFISYRKDD